MLLGSAARLRVSLRLARRFRVAAGLVVSALACGAATPAWSACLTSTLVLTAPPYTNSQCITPPSDNDGIRSTGSTYTLNNSGDITIQSTSPAPGGLGSQAINAASTGDLTVINNGALTATATGTGDARGILADQSTETATGTVTVMNSGAIVISATASAGSVGISGGGGQTTNLTNSAAITASGSGFLIGINADTGIITCTVNCSGVSSNAVSNVTNTGTIVVNGGTFSHGIYVSTAANLSASANVTNLGTITVTGAGNTAIGGFVQTVPVLPCPIATCVFGNGPLNISNGGRITATSGAFLFFGSFLDTNPINVITNTGTLDGQLRNPSLSAGSFTASDLTNSGLFTISYAGAGLAQIVDGKFTQTGSGTLGLRVNAAGQHDSLTARSTSLGGTLLAITQPGNYANVTQYAGVVQSTAPITTKFDNVGTNNAFFMATATYNPNTVDLTLTRQQFGLLSGLTFNERAVGNALEAGFAAGGASGPGAGIYTALFGLQTVQQAANAYDQLSGEIHADTQSVILDDSRYAREAILGRLRQFGFLGGGGPMASLGTGGPAVAYAEPAEDALAYSGARGSAFPIKAPPAPRSDTDPTFWTQALGAWGGIDGDGNAADVRRDLAGFFAGVDRRFGDWRAGIVGGATSATVSVAARASSATIDAAHLGGYAGTSYGAFNLRTGADFAWNNVSTNRTIAFPGFADTANARYGAGEAQVFGEVGYGMAFGRIATEPFGGLAFVHLHTDSFAEAGGIAALAGGSNDEDVGYATLGIRTATTYVLANGMALTPRASAAWQHAFGDVTPAAALAFQSIGTSFAINGAPIARDAALVSAGADLRVRPQAAFGIAYVSELAGNAQDHSIKGMFTWKF